jgi:hypothetical protein
LETLNYGFFFSSLFFFITLNTSAKLPLIANFSSYFLAYSFLGFNLFSFSSLSFKSKIMSKAYTLLEKLVQSKRKYDSNKELVEVLEERVNHLIEQIKKGGYNEIESLDKLYETKE